MPQLMPGTTKRMTLGEIVSGAADKIDRLAGSMVPPGFNGYDTENAAAHGQVGKAYGIAQNEGRLAGLAELARNTQMSRGGVNNPGDPTHGAWVSARQLLSRFRPKNPGNTEFPTPTGLPSNVPAPTVREFIESGSQQPPPIGHAAEMLDSMRGPSNLAIPYKAGGEGLSDVLIPGVGGNARRLSPMGEGPAGRIPEAKSRQMLEELYGQFLEANQHGHTYN